MAHDTGMSAAPSGGRLRRLVDTIARCLWFLREDCYPQTPTAREMVLRLIERHGYVQGLGRVAEVL
jgi:hypothetical protein